MSERTPGEHAKVLAAIADDCDTMSKETTKGMDLTRELYISRRDAALAAIDALAEVERLKARVSELEDFSCTPMLPKGGAHPLAGVNVEDVRLVARTQIARHHERYDYKYDGCTCIGCAAARRVLAELEGK